MRITGAKHHPTLTWNSPERPGQRFYRDGSGDSPVGKYASVPRARTIIDVVVTIHAVIGGDQSLLLIFASGMCSYVKKEHDDVRT